MTALAWWIMQDITLTFYQENPGGNVSHAVKGIKRMLEMYNDICCGKGREGDLELLMEIAEIVEEASLCSLRSKKLCQTQL